MSAVEAVSSSGVQMTPQSEWHREFIGGTRPGEFGRVSRPVSVPDGVGPDTTHMEKAVGPMRRHQGRWAHFPHWTGRSDVWSGGSPVLNGDATKRNLEVVRKLRMEMPPASRRFFFGKLVEHMLVEGATIVGANWALALGNVMKLMGER